MKLYRRAVGYFREDRSLIGIFLALIAFGIGLGLLQDWVTPVLIDSVLTPSPRTDWVDRLFLFALPHHRLGQVIGITLIGMCMKIAQDLSGMFRAMLNNTINNYGTMRVRQHLYRKLQSLDLGFHKSLPQGDAIYRLSADALGPQIILNVLMNTFVDAATLIVMFIIMFSRSGPLALVALSVAPLLVVTNLYFGPRIKARTIDAKRVDANMTTAVQRAMSAIGLIQSFRRESHEESAFNNITFTSARSWLRLNWQEEGYKLVSGTIFSLGGAVIFGYGGFLVYRDMFLHPIPDGVTMGTLLVFMAYLTKMWGPLGRLTSIGAAIQPGVAGAERVFEVLDRTPRVEDPVNGMSLPAKPMSIVLDQVEFEYSGGNPVLRGIDATIEPGRLVAFVGHSGAGKSTVLNLLARFYDPTHGAIWFGGRDARRIKLDDLRRYVAIVPQDSPMLATSIADNIAFGSPNSTRAQIRKAAAQAGADDFIEAFPDGYDTVLSEGGSNLSGGQRQRIAIARALLTDAPVIVFDEPTSALDQEAEHLVMNSIERLRGHRTVVVVSHRLSTVENFDKIFVMAEGRIVEQGGHVELMAKKGVYAHLLDHEEAVPDGMRAA